MALFLEKGHFHVAGKIIRFDQSQVAPKRGEDLMCHNGCQSQRLGN